MKILRIATVAAIAIAASTYSHADDFDSCLLRLQDEARSAGVSERTVANVIPGLTQQARVLELDRKQPEFVQTFGDYLAARVTEKRVTTGRERYAEYRPFLDQLTRQYGVPGHYLVAFWGLETNFGGYLGNMPTLDSLATLACDERRSKFFSSELITALQLLDRHELPVETMRGSWAGAMGHTQFMPSNYARYAVDGDGDGRVDLWNSPRDALASGANFLQQLGWERGLRWGREVTLPANFPFGRSGLEQATSLQDWRTLGVRRADGPQLPAIELEGAILVPSGSRGPAFLVYQNFHVIMRWNRSESYAIAVGHLADRIAGAGELLRQPPPDQKALNRAQTTEMQTYLEAAGYLAGGVDGIAGPATRRALRDFQREQKLVADGYPDAASLQQLRSYAEKR